MSKESAKDYSVEELEEARQESGMGCLPHDTKVRTEVFFYDIGRGIEKITTVKSLIKWWKDVKANPDRWGEPVIKVEEVVAFDTPFKKETGMVFENVEQHAERKPLSPEDQDIVNAIQTIMDENKPLSIDIDSFEYSPRRFWKNQTSHQLGNYYDDLSTDGRINPFYDQCNGRDRKKKTLSLPTRLIETYINDTEFHLNNENGIYPKDPEFRKRVLHSKLEFWVCWFSGYVDEIRKKRMFSKSKEPIVVTFTDTQCSTIDEKYKVIKQQITRFISEDKSPEDFDTLSVDIYYHPDMQGGTYSAVFESENKTREGYIFDIINDKVYLLENLGEVTQALTQLDDPETPDCSATSEESHSDYL